MVVSRWQIFPRGCSMIFEGLPNAPSTAHGARSAAATELRRSRCCDEAATESLLRRSCADQLRRAHSAHRVRDRADAAATELMLRAALLRRSCNGVAAPTESLLRRSCADQFRRAHSARRISDATRRMRPAFIFPRVDLNFNGRGPQS